MPVSDLDIARSAHLFIQLHGDEAIPKARKMVEEMRRKGYQEGRYVAAHHRCDRRARGAADRGAALAKNTTGGADMFKPPSKHPAID
jgi:hypothetical protein